MTWVIFLIAEAGAALTNIFDKLTILSFIVVVAVVVVAVFTSFFINDLYGVRREGGLEGGSRSSLRRRGAWKRTARARAMGGRREGCLD
jgi:uncharacterized protein YqgC (DUF456 family)